MMEDVIEISPSPELMPRNVYRPLRRKRDSLFIPDGDDSAIELTDTDSQSSTSCKRVKRIVDPIEPGAAGPSSLPYVPVGRARALSPRLIGRALKSRRGRSPASWHAASMPQIATPPIQNQDAHPAPGFWQEAVQMEPLAGPSRDQLPNHDPMTPASDHVPVNHELQPPANTAYSKVAQEPDERLVERVREVVPDVLPSHVLKLLAKHKKKATFSGILLDTIIHNLLEDQSYPRDTKGKGKERPAEKKVVEFFGNNSMNIDYTHPNADKPVGSAYRVLSMTYLSTNFPDTDKALILEALSLHAGHYAPAYLYLLQNGATPTSVSPVSPEPGKRRKKARRKSCLTDEDLVKEHTWLVEGLRYRRNSPAIPQVEDEEGGDIECGCCFSSYPFDKMAQCMDTHLFCKSCVTSYASARLGEQNSDLRCMDISGCKMSFPDSELRRILPDKLFDLYEQIRQRRDIELAGLEGLEECPFCDFKVVIDAEFQADKVLRCQNEDCGRVSCRKCKEEDHLPKSCEEFVEDRRLDGKHTIEEAMTRALMRNCPKCQKAFVKEYGCNKMTCTYCRTVSCYVCRSIIKGYDHFDQSRPNDARRPGSSSTKCPLWDSGEDRHTKEVAAAADKALKEYKALHPDVKDEDIRVELPPAPPGMRTLDANPLGGGRWAPPPPYVQVHHAHNAHVPVAHPVVPLPFPPAPPQFNFDHLFAPGMPDFAGGELPLHPPQRLEPQFRMPAQFNPLLPPPPPPAIFPPPQLPPPLPPPPLQLPALQQDLPPIQVVFPAARGMLTRARRRRR